MLKLFDQPDNADIHDVEHRSDAPHPSSGFPLEALSNPEEREKFRLNPPYQPLGPGEQSSIDT